MLPVDSLLRRRDLAEVIGEARWWPRWLAPGIRRIARGRDVPADTVRGWLRRFLARAGEIREHFTGLAHVLGANLAVVESLVSPAADALEAIGSGSEALS